MYYIILCGLIVQFCTKSKHIVWYSDHITFLWSIEICYVNKYFLYVTFYYIKKYPIDFVAPGNVVVMVQTKTHYTWRRKASESTSSLPRSHCGPSPSFSGSLWTSEVLGGRMQRQQIGVGGGGARWASACHQSYQHQHQQPQSNM